jgi:Protein of unknown function (DUF3891)
VLVLEAPQQKLQLVLHTELARLMGHLAAWWGNAEFAPLTPYVSMVVAAQDHAASWHTWEMKPYLDLDGRPIDAVRGARFLGLHWIDLYVEAVASLAQRDVYAALIASMHWETQLLRLREAWPPGLESVLAEQQLLREHLVEVLREEGGQARETDAAQLATNRLAMNVLDRLATFIVSASSTDSGDALTVRAPLRPPGAELDLKLTRRESNEVVVDPYPFGVDPLQVSFTSRLLADRAHASQAEFLEHFYRTPLVYTSCMLTR